MNDIIKIKEELVSHLKVELPYTFTKDTHIKYLTLKDEDELFYRGGKFCFQKGNCIYLNNCGKRWKVPINYYDNDGNIIYTTTFFIKNCDEENIESNKDSKRKDEIILTQQELIKKLTKKIRELEYQLMINDS
jgi:hypothetical protein